MQINTCSKSYLQKSSVVDVANEAFDHIVTASQVKHSVSEFTFEFQFGSFDVNKFGEDLVFRLYLLVCAGVF